MRERLVALKKTQNELEQGLQLLSRHWHPLNISEKVPRKSVASMLNTPAYRFSIFRTALLQETKHRKNKTGQARTLNIVLKQGNSEWFGEKNFENKLYYQGDKIGNTKFQKLSKRNYMQNIQMTDFLQ